MRKKDNGLIKTFIGMVKSNDDNIHHERDYHIEYFNKSNVWTLTTNYGLKNVLKLNQSSKQVIYNPKDKNAVEIAHMLENEDWNISAGDTSIMTEGEY